MNVIKPFLAVVLSVASVAAAAGGADELWEFTTKVQMNGMSLPGNVNRSCLTKNSVYRPDQSDQDKNCTFTDYKVVGNRASWKMKCTGEAPMEGSGYMVRTGNAMSGNVSMKSAGEHMAMKMEGRIVGTCDAEAERRKVDRMVADATAEGERAQAAMQQKSCDGIRNAVSTSFQGYEMFHAQAQTQETRAVLQKCKIDLETARKRLCGKLTPQDARYGQKYCPAEYADMRLALCSGGGRNGSYRTFCDGGAAGAPDGREDAANPAKSMMDGAKGLMKMFGF